MTQRDEKGKFVKSAERPLGPNEDIDVTFPIEKTEEKKVDTSAQEAAKNQALAYLREEKDNYDKRMKAIDDSFAAHVKRQATIDWLMIIMLSSMCGYWLGVAAIAIFK